MAASFLTSAGASGAYNSIRAFGDRKLPREYIEVRRLRVAAYGEPNGFGQLRYCQSERHLREHMHDFKHVRFAKTHSLRPSLGLKSAKPYACCRWKPHCYRPVYNSCQTPFTL